MVLEEALTWPRYGGVMAAVHSNYIKSSYRTRTAVYFVIANEDGL